MGKYANDVVLVDGEIKKSSNQIIFSKEDLEKWFKKEMEEKYQKDKEEMQLKFHEEMVRSGLLKQK